MKECVYTQASQKSWVREVLAALHLPIHQGDDRVSTRHAWSCFLMKLPASCWNIIWPSILSWGLLRDWLAQSSSWSLHGCQTLQAFLQGSQLRDWHLRICWFLHQVEVRETWTLWSLSQAVELLLSWVRRVLASVNLKVGKLGHKLLGLWICSY